MRRNIVEGFPKKTLIKVQAARFNMIFGDYASGRSPARLQQTDWGPSILSYFAAYILTLNLLAGFMIVTGDFLLKGGEARKEVCCGWVGRATSGLSAPLASPGLRFYFVEAVGCAVLNGSRFSFRSFGTRGKRHCFSLWIKFSKEVSVVGQSGKDEHFFSVAIILLNFNSNQTLCSMLFLDFFKA